MSKAESPMEKMVKRREERRARMRANSKPCAMIDDGGCDDVITRQTKQSDGRWLWLCSAHYLSENAEGLAAEAEAARLPKELYCFNCEIVVDPADVDDGTWYYCEDCGEEFNRDATGDHRCPECNKFATRSDTEHCANCREELEERPVEMVS
jgi:hypothetical protein